MLAMAGLLVAMTIALTATLVIGARLLDMDVAWDHIAAASTASALLGLLFGGLGYLIGAWTGRRAEALERTLPYNPFQWSIGADALLTGWNADYLLRLAGAAVVLLVGAVLVFQRRDIGT